MDCEIAIIGAGMAGLGAARECTNRGHTNVLVIEASSSPGGRVKSERVGNNVIELGAQWLHGTGSRLYSIAAERNLIHEANSNEASGVYVRNDGLIIDNELVNKIDFYVGRIFEDLESFADAEEHPESVGDFLETEFRKMLDLKDYDREMESLSLELFNWHERFQMIDNSCSSLKDISAKQWGNYECYAEGGQAHINLKGGYGALVQAIIKELPNNILLYDTSIKKISYDDKLRKIKLMCSNDNTITASHIILTVPLGVLKDHRKLFTFPLPTTLTNTIDNMGFGGLGKIFLSFDYKWWKSEGIQLIWRKDTQQVDDWTKYLSGFDTLYNQPNMLIGWVASPGIAEMEKLKDDIIGRQCVDLLRAFLKDDDIPYPVEVRKTSWLSNPWIRGGYSYATPACDRLGLGPKDLLEPVYFHGVPRVLLAGEAAHPSHFSTTHGAFDSGIGQAVFLCRFLDGNGL